MDCCNSATQPWTNAEEGAKLGLVEPESPSRPSQSRCRLQSMDRGLDVVVEGDAVRVTDADVLKRLAEVWAWGA
jgi:hypothetical protein